MSTKGSGSPRGISRREFFKRAGQSAAAAAAVSTLGFPAVVRGAAADTIKIGHIHPLTGFLAFDGGQLRKGMLMAVDEINKAGGIKALGGAKLELLDGDSEGKPEVAITQMERFNSAGCLAVFGCYQSAVTLVATQEAEKYHIPFMVTVAVADEVTGRGFKYTFRTQPDGTQMTRQTLDYLAAVAKQSGTSIKTISYLHDNTAFGQSLFALVKKYAPDHGWEIALDMPYSPRATDVSTEINKIKFAGSDIVMHSGYFNDSIRALRTMRDLRVQAKGIVGLGNAAYSHTKFVAEAGDASNHVMDGNYRANPNNPHTTRVMAAYKARFNEDMPVHAVYAYQPVYIFADALERAGKADRGAVRDALAKTHYTNHILPQGPIVYGADGQNENARAALMQVIDKKVRVVWPAPYAEAKPVFPQ
ncbi:MAG TPA: ABC transporter substrate-binding protein [bacterium]|nr:ABC transporter substrate-binding protein [bacterium]